MSMILSLNTSRFLELFTCALWSRVPTASHFEGMTDEDWKQILSQARQQGVISFVADAIEELPQSLKPAKSIMIPLLMQREAVEKQHDRTREAIKGLAKEYKSLGIPFVLLKGQGNAQYYPRPDHRSPGDIDIFFYREEDIPKVFDHLKSGDLELEEPTKLHVGYKKDGMYIEAHRKVTYFYSPKMDKRLDQVVEENTRSEVLEYLQIGDEKVGLLPITFNVFFVFAHLFRHFLHEGIGLRQVGDWLMMLEQRHQDIDASYHAELAQTFGLLDAMKSFGGMAVRYLGVRPEIFPFDTSDAMLVDEVMDDILQGGNFGIHRDGRDLQLNKVGQFHRYRAALRRARKFGPIAPGYFRRGNIGRAKNRLLMDLGLIQKNRWE